MSSTLLNCIDCAGGGIINVNHCNNIKTVYGSATVYWYIQTNDTAKHILVASNDNTIIFGFVDVNTNLVIISSLFFTTTFTMSSYRNKYLSIDHITFNDLNFYPYTFPNYSSTTGPYGNYVAGIIYITTNDNGKFNNGTDINITYKNFLFYYKDSNYDNALYTVRTSDGSMFEWTNNFTIVKLIDVEFSTKLNDVSRYQNN